MFIVITSCVKPIEIALINRLKVVEYENYYEIHVKIIQNNAYTQLLSSG